MFCGRSTSRTTGSAALGLTLEGAAAAARSPGNHVRTAPKAPTALATAIVAITSDVNPNVGVADRLGETAPGRAPTDRWRALRAAIHEDVCRRGFDPGRNAFVQSYGASELDASLLMIPLVGFLPAEDPRVRGTVAAIEGELLVDGLVQRYPTESGVDGLPPGEGLFLACSFWLVDNLVLLGRGDEARRLYERLLALRNDVGLLAEQYDPRARRQLGNFPQALSHIALVNSACNLSQAGRPARLRADA